MSDITNPHPLFPKEGAVLMKTAAQEWIEEALAEGIQKGEAIGIQKAQRQTILQPNSAKPLPAVRRWVYGEW